MGHITNVWYTSDQRRATLLEFTVVSSSNSGAAHFTSAQSPCCPGKSDFGYLVSVEDEIKSAELLLGSLRLNHVLKELYSLHTFPAILRTWQNSKHEIEF